MAAHLKRVNQEDGISVIPPKCSKQQLNDEYMEEPSCFQSFRKIKECKILNHKQDNKVIFLEGKVNDDGEEKSSVVILEKKPFEVDSTSLAKWFEQNTDLKLILQNDIYSTFDAVPPSELNKVKVTLIHPATEKHLEKYKKQKFILIEETLQMYESITLPYLKKNQFSVKWVENILNKKKESERIIFDDPDPDNGFILLPDMKWDGKAERLYLIALPYRMDIKSLRDLNEKHLQLLNNILTKGKKVISEKYGVEGSHLLIYLHYQPSYYHLHVHFTHTEFDAPGTIVTRAHLLSDVIENITTKSDFYQRKTLTYSLRESDKLLPLLQSSDIQSSDI